MTAVTTPYFDVTYTMGQSDETNTSEVARRFAGLPAIAIEVAEIVTHIFLAIAHAFALGVAILFKALLGPDFGLAPEKFDPVQHILLAGKLIAGVVCTAVFGLTVPFFNQTVHEKLGLANTHDVAPSNPSDTLTTATAAAGEHQQKTLAELAANDAAARSAYDPVEPPAVKPELPAVAPNAPGVGTHVPALVVVHSDAIAAAQPSAATAAPAAH